MMRFYGLSDEQVLQMPVRRFWLLHKNVDRIAAEEDIRVAAIAASVQSGESFNELMNGLRKQMGEVVIIDRISQAMTEKLDRVGLAMLKGMKKVGESV